MPAQFVRSLAVAWALVFALAAPAARALTPADLPPVDQVFKVSATASAPDRIDVQWSIAKGYYLYRHQFKFSADANFRDLRASIPAGTPHHDEFFGDVETYRERVTVPLSGIPKGESTVLTVRYQGCADAGICYPPTTKTLRVALSAPASPSNPFAALTGAQGVSNAVAPGGGLVARGDASDLALPAERAFQIQARVVGNDLRVQLIPVEGYYLYQRQLRVVSSSKAVALGAPQWPAAQMHNDPEFGRVPVYFKPVELVMPLHLNAQSPRSAGFTVHWQGCKDQGVCYPPMTRSFTLPLPAFVPGAMPAAVTLPPDTPVSSDDAVRAAPATVVAAPGVDLSSPPSPGAVATQESAMPQAPAAVPRPAWLILAFALLGGLILNLMPCVLPVLSLKAVSLAQHGADPSSARKHALAYAAGVLLSFAVLGGLLLALRGLGDAVGWAFQMQQPLVVGFLALLMFALGLSLSGVWHAGGKWLGLGQSLTTTGNTRGDFFTGLLAVVVATPCIAPFMGAAMAWAFFAPWALAMLVFLALGLGMALPFLLIGFVPGLARLLPKPGLWMDTFKHWMAFPMYLTAIWLAWVVGQQRGALGMAWLLVAALLIGIAAWAWTRAAQLGKPLHRLIAVLMLVLAAVTLWHVHRLPAESSVSSPLARNKGEQSFDASRIAALNAEGRTVFVNITADWCISCKVNEKAVLHTDAFRSLLASSNAVYMVGDYTNVSPDLTAYLNSFRAVGVPLYVVYRPGQPPAVLPTLLTRALVEDALK